jgi:hypothetical protein
VRRKNPYASNNLAKKRIMDQNFVSSYIIAIIIGKRINNQIGWGKKRG